MLSWVTVVMPCRCRVTLSTELKASTELLTVSVLLNMKMEDKTSFSLYEGLLQILKNK